MTVGGGFWHNGSLVSGARPAPSNLGCVASPRATLPDQPHDPGRTVVHYARQLKSPSLALLDQPLRAAAPVRTAAAVGSIAAAPSPAAAIALP